MTDKTEIVVGSGNVYEDGGVSGANEMLVKAQLVSYLDDLIADEQITQTAAAERIGVAQSDLSRILTGKFREYSVDRIMRMVAGFDCDVEIVLRSRRSDVAEVHVSVPPKIQQMDERTR